MTSPRTARPLTRDGGFAKALKVALDGLERPRVAVVAATQARADFIRDLCRRSGPEDVAAYVEAPALGALRQAEHQILVLDASLPEPSRANLKKIARGRTASCRVIEVRKWSAEPPA